MSDIIKLLPDSVANQIAAGEVVQRPASVIKELLENAIDAGATSIDIVVKDAGKMLIQIVDNGKGMSVSDARMAFERHATSKINKAEDLFSISSFGFRGEALASIASVARIELKTRTEENEVGVQIIIEGSKFISQEICNSPIGTNIQVKDLFFNIPARRQFLKNNNIEMHHIWEEIYHVAIPNHDVSFKIYEDDKHIATHIDSNLQQRIISLFGKNYNQKLFPIEQKTEYVNVVGFIVKPEFSKKKRGEQYIFVNNRFIRSAYINAAIKNAYSGLINPDVHPGYFIFIDVDPAEIDINIHPTKTEIKFRDERMVTAIIASVIKKSLGTNNAMPSIDFESEPIIDFSLDPNRQIKIPEIKINPNYNPFESAIPTNSFSNFNKNINIGCLNQYLPTQPNSQELFDDDKQNISSETFMQVGRKYILSIIMQELILIDQQAASMRIIFDKLIQNNSVETNNSRLLMFPETISINPADAAIMAEISDELNEYGFVISHLGTNTFSVSAVPNYLELKGVKLTNVFDEVIELYKSSGIIKTENCNAVILAMAKKLSIKHGNFLNKEMMQILATELFASSNPEISPDGKKTYSIIYADELAKWLK